MGGRESAGTVRPTGFHRARRARRRQTATRCYLCAQSIPEGIAHAGARRCAGEARFPHHRAIRRAGPRAGASGHARGDRARRAARLRLGVAALPASAVRRLLPDRDARGRNPAHLENRARHGRDPARLGEPAPAGRGPGDRRRALRRPAQPGVQRRAADALGRRAGGAVSRHGRRRGLQLHAGRAAAWVRRRGARVHVRRGRRLRAVLLAGAAALPRAAVPDVVRRRVAGIGPMGGRERGELPDLVGGAGGGGRRLRVDSAVPYPGVPRMRTRPERRRGCRRGSS